MLRMFLGMPEILAACEACLCIDTESTSSGLEPKLAEIPPYANWPILIHSGICRPWSLPQGLANGP